MRGAVNDWSGGLVTGNGRQGAVVWGGPDEVRITLSHERLFRPMRPPPDPPDTARILPELRRLLATGRYAEAAGAVCAAAVAEDPGYAETVWIDPLVGAGTLRIRPAARSGDIRFGLDERTGVITVRCGGARMEVFASRPHDAIVVRLSGDWQNTVRITPVDGIPPPSGMDWSYRISCRVLPGPVLILRTRTPGEPDPPVPADVRTLLEEHRAVHGDLLGRVRLDLPDDPLTQRCFDSGRYLIVSSTGELPPTLQGVWSGSWTPPWSSGYTLDGNLPAAVAALLPTGTPELMLPVFDLVESVRDDLRRNARRCYGARGLLAPVHLSTHGRQIHFGPIWCQTFWTAGAGWLSRLYVDYWRYTGDDTFLRERALPFLRESAEFLLDFVQITGGRAVFAPSYSPENAPANTGSQAAVDATMDVAIARDLLGNLLALDGDHARAPRWRALRDALPDYRISDGRLAEWCHPGLADNPAHRHASHLWPLWYEPDPLITGDPALRAAAVAAVRARLAWWAGEGADEMAYGLAQLGLAAAALGLAEEAHACVRWMSGRYWGRNGVPRHNRDAIFNVDIAGGLPAVVARMLAHSAHGRLDLLPALPRAWPRGAVTGLAVRDAVTVDRLSWTPDGAEAVLHAARDTRLTVWSPERGRLWAGLLCVAAPLTLSWERRQNGPS